MKHGPIALLDEQTPVVCIATTRTSTTRSSRTSRRCGRAGRTVIAIATDGNEDIQHHADDVVYVPRTHPFLQAPWRSSPPALAYRIARLRGLNIDQPRNLAKTVTVE
jgi:glucosamine--fructose-6-phosphate aminotransferase (isomerizing)